MTRYRLIRGQDVLGLLTTQGSDMPWLLGMFEPTPAFEEVQDLFQEELRLLDADDMDAWAKVWNKIAEPGLRLEPTDGGEPIADFLVHIRGQKAWWRY
jgi:hypothetical protein